MFERVGVVGGVGTQALALENADSWLEGMNRRNVGKMKFTVQPEHTDWL